MDARVCVRWAGVPPWMSLEEAFPRREPPILRRFPPGLRAAWALFAGGDRLDVSGVARGLQIGRHAAAHRVRRLVELGLIKPVGEMPVTRGAYPRRVYARTSLGGV